MKMKLTLLIITTFFLFSCGKNDNSPVSSGGGKGGSLARFAVVGDQLYTVTPQMLNIFDISDEKNPTFKTKVPIGIDIETIFPLGNTLFVGSEGGMYMYDITNPLVPRKLSSYEHVRSCDPVVANDNYAFVTLSTSAIRCSRGLNQLEIVDISNKTQPRTIKVYPMVKPLGMALNGNNLYVCDDVVKWYDISAVPTLTAKGTINIKARDAIIVNNIIMLVGEKGLSQYDISGAQPTFLSQITVGKL